MPGSSGVSFAMEGCSPTILFIDSGSADIGGAAAGLRDCGASIYVASGADVALEMALGTSPSLIILDEDDLESCRVLQSEESLSHIPVILLTSTDGSPGTIGESQPRVFDFVAKPVRQEELLPRIAVLLKIGEQTKAWRKQAKALEQTNERLTEEIAERERAERRLRFLSSAVEQSDEGIALIDLDGELLFVNQAFASIHGYEPAEILGKHFSIFHTPEQMRAVEEAVKEMRETEHFRGEIWHVHRDGTAFPALMNNSLLRGDTGEPIGFIGTLRDITDQLKVQEALRLSEVKYRLLFDNTTGSGVDV